MSTSITPGRDLLHHVKIPGKESLFTTFERGHFIRPGQFTQPVKSAIAETPAIQPATFAGCFTEVYAAAPIDLDYDEPNAVVDAELELVQSSGPVHQMELPVVNGMTSNEPAVIQTPRSAA